MARRSRRRKQTFNVDLSEVEGRVSVPDGRYLVKVAGWEAGEGDAGEYIRWQFEVVNGKQKGGKIWNTTSFSPDSLWNLKNFLLALQADIPDSAFDLDPEEYMGMELMVEVEKDGRYTNVIDFGVAEDGDEEDEPASKSRSRTRRGRNADADEDAEEDERPSRRASKRSRSRDEDEEDEEEAPRTKRGKASRDEDEDEEEDERPTKRGKANGKRPVKLSEDEVLDMDQDSLQEVIDAHKLDVDLDEHKTLSRMKKAVVKALDSEGVLA